MMQTGGLDFLMGWGIFVALLVLLGVFLVRGRDPTSESQHGNDESTSPRAEKPDV